MTPEQQRTTFYFEEHPAGYFDSEAIPSTPGRYSYMPFRSLAHDRLCSALRSAGPQRCHFLVGDKKHHFTVSAWISYGLLELTDFESQES